MPATDLVEELDHRYAGVFLANLDAGPGRIAVLVQQLDAHRPSLDEVDTHAFRPVRRAVPARDVAEQHLAVVVLRPLQRAALGAYVKYIGILRVRRAFVGATGGQRYAVLHGVGRHHAPAA